MHLIFVGLLLGWGAAIPIGPINLEIARRNLSFGTPYGVALGVGASLADLTYLLLLCLGALSLLAYPNVLKIIGIGGALVLMWFAYKAFRAGVSSASIKGGDKSILHNVSEGFLLTLLNPYTILFWGSISSQLTAISKQGDIGIILAGVGVILGIFCWVAALNSVLHFTRHKLSPKVMRGLNIVGGVIILGFACYGLFHNLNF